MGTRADFYVGKGKEAVWLGSLAFDGSPCGLHPTAGCYVNDPTTVPVLVARNEAEYRDKVAELLKAKARSSTTPDMGWPWPWEDSRTSDYAYCFYDGKTWGFCFGRGPFDPLHEPDELDEAKAEFPDMTAVKNVTMGPRSGLIVVEGPR